MCLPSKKSVRFEPYMSLSDLFLLTLPASPQLLAQTSFSAPVRTRAADTQALHSGWESLSSLEVQQLHLLPPPYNRPATLSSLHAAHGRRHHSQYTPRAAQLLAQCLSHEWPLCFAWALSSNLLVLSQRKKKCAAVRQLQSNRMNISWEGDGGSKTVSLTFFLTCIWL